MVQHLVWLAFLIPWRAARGNWPYLRGVWTAFRKLPLALKRRREMKPLWTRTDAEVWALVRGNGFSPSPGHAGTPIRPEPANAGSLSD